MDTNPTIYLVAGEASGDAHGASLMASLRARAGGIRFLGAGGERMRAASGGAVVDWSDHAVIGVVDVLRNYGYFKAQLERMLGEIARERPDAVVLIDYPGFNLRLAARLRRLLPEMKIVYYISPQVWAWNRGRIPRMARILDLMLCIFPFEEELYNQSGLRTRFVGHPLTGRLAASRIAAPRESDLIALLPGSRNREVRRIFPVMLDTVHRLAAERELRFAASAPRAALAEEMRAQARAAGLGPPRLEIATGAAHDVMQRAAAGLVASGTATLEAAFFGLPFALVYKVSWATYWPARLLVRIPYLGIVNILAGRQVVAEYIQARATAPRLAAELGRLLDDDAYRRSVLDGCAEAIELLGSGNASDQAAGFLLEEIARGRG